MEPTSFEQSNVILSPPEGTDLDKCEVLSVFKGNDRDGQPVVISCWKLTKEELEELVKYGRVWLIVSGETTPPVALTAVSPWA